MRHQDGFGQLKINDDELEAGESANAGCDGLMAGGYGFKTRGDVYNILS